MVNSSMVSSNMSSLNAHVLIRCIVLAQICTSKYDVGTRGNQTTKKIKMIY
jgi:hypothetical protein